MEACPPDLPGPGGPRLPIELFRTATGVAFGRDRVCLEVVRATPFGVGTVARTSLPLEGREPEEILAALGAAGWWRGQVVLGLDLRREYTAARPGDDLSLGDDAGALSGVLATLPGGVLVEACDLKARNLQFRRITACPRLWAEKVAGGLAGRGRKALLVPIPPALARLGERLDREGSGRRGCVVRVFPGQRTGLAVLVLQRAALAWRQFPLSPEGETATAMLAAVNALAVHARTDLSCPPVAEVVLHDGAPPGPQDRHCQEACGAALRHAPRLRAEPEDMAGALARAAVGRRKPGPDLLAPLRPSPGILAHLPWGGMAAFFLVVAVARFLLAREVEGFETTASQTRQAAELAAARVGIHTAEVETRKQQLANEARLVRDFVSSRILWTRLLQVVARAVPEDVTLENIEGSNPLPVPGPGFRTANAARPTLTLRGTAPFGDSETSIPGMERLLVALQGEPEFATAFPVMAGANVLRKEEFGSEVAVFSLEYLGRKGPGPGPR